MQLNYICSKLQICHSCIDAHVPRKPNSYSISQSILKSEQLIHLSHLPKAKSDWTGTPMSHCATLCSFCCLLLSRCGWRRRRREPSIVLPPLDGRGGVVKKKSNCKQAVKNVTLAGFANNNKPLSNASMTTVVSFQCKCLCNKLCLHRFTHSVRWRQETAGGWMDRSMLVLKSRGIQTTRTE